MSLESIEHFESRMTRKALHEAWEMNAKRWGNAMRRMYRDTLKSESPIVRAMSFRALVAGERARIERERGAPITIHSGKTLILASEGAREAVVREMQRRIHHSAPMELGLPQAAHETPIHPPASQEGVA